MARCDWQRGRSGLTKFLRHNEVLAGFARLSFSMNVASLPQVKMMHAIDAIGALVAPAWREQPRLSRTTNAVVKPPKGNT